MDRQYWLNAWSKSGEPGWQQSDVHEALQSHWVADDTRVFVPLCGRSPDLAWLHQIGHEVIGVELSEAAVAQFFNEQQLDCSISHSDDFTVYAADQYQIYVGDFFSLRGDNLKGVKKVYDRAAMVAMSGEWRHKYVRHLQSIVPAVAEYLVILLEYDQAQMNGPPFSVPESAFRECFDSSYEVRLIGDDETDFSHRGVEQAREKTYRVAPRGQT